MRTLDSVAERHEQLQKKYAKALGKLAFKGFSADNARRVNEARQEWQACTELLKLLRERPDLEYSLDGDKDNP